jgi:hypothetical protein
MKIAVLKVCFSISLVAGAILSLNAQPQHEGLAPRELQDAYHPELNLSDDKTLLFEQEPKPKTSPDSLSFHSAKSSAISSSALKLKSDNKHPEKDEEDALSFNFLYYIIQEFKITDLVDE